MHFKKADMRTKQNFSPRLSSASVITLLRSYRQSKERRTRLCEKSDRKQGRNAQHLPSFLFFSPSFSENNATHRPVSRGGDTKNFRRQSKLPRKRNCTRPLLHKDTRRHNLPTPGMHTADRRTCVHFPHPLAFRSHTKKQLPIFRWIAV